MNINLTELAQQLANALQRHIDNCTCQHFPHPDTTCYTCLADRQAVAAWDGRHQLSLDLS